MSSLNNNLKMIFSINFNNLKNMFQPSDDFTMDTEVKEGDSIKIKNIEGETFWVTVRDVSRYGNFTGKVDNHLILGANYNFGDIVSFKKEHIRGHKNREIKEKQKLLVTFFMYKLIIKLGRKPTVEELDYFLTNVTPSDSK